MRACSRQECVRRVPVSLKVWANTTFLFPRHASQEDLSDIKGNKNLCGWKVSLWHNHGHRAFSYCSREALNDVRGRLGFRVTLVWAPPQLTEIHEGRSAAGRVSFSALARSMNIEVGRTR